MYEVHCFIPTRQVHGRKDMRNVAVRRISAMLAATAAFVLSAALAAAPANASVKGTGDGQAYTAVDHDW